MREVRTGDRRERCGSCKSMIEHPMSHTSSRVGLALEIVDLPAADPQNGAKCLPGYYPSQRHRSPSRSGSESANTQRTTTYGTFDLPSNPSSSTPKAGRTSGSPFYQGDNGSSSNKTKEEKQKEREDAKKEDEEKRKEKEMEKKMEEERKEKEKREKEKQASNYLDKHRTS